MVIVSGTGKSITGVPVAIDSIITKPKALAGVIGNRVAVAPLSN